MKVEVTLEQDYLKIYLNEIPHLSLYIKDLVGVQSYVESASWYNIEYTFKGKALVRSQYSDKEVWQEVLKLINEFI